MKKKLLLVGIWWHSGSSDLNCPRMPPVPNSPLHYPYSLGGTRDGGGSFLPRNTFIILITDKTKVDREENKDKGDQKLLSWVKTIVAVASKKDMTRTVIYKMTWTQT